MKKLIILFSALGLLDALYLTYEHYARIIPPCSTNWWVDCGKVLSSPYSMLLGLVPLALLGVFHYSAELVVAYLYATRDNPIFLTLLKILTTIGLISSLYFVYLMIFVIHAICIYCFSSAIISLLLFISTIMIYPQNQTLMIK